MKQKKSIQNVELAFSCPQNWDNLTVCGNGRFCTVCQKIVYDFTDKSQKDYETALRQHGGQMCGRFTNQQMAPSVNFAKAAALAALSLVSGCHKELILDSIPNSTPTTQQVAPQQELAILGMVVEPNPEFIGGTKAMYQFLRENIKYPTIAKDACSEGTVYIGFIVETDGRLTNIKVKRGFHPDFSAEAVRVVDLMSGKWKAGIQNGKPVRVSYTLPIKFKLE